jgi:hypothetical protein
MLDCFAGRWITSALSFLKPDDQILDAPVTWLPHIGSPSFKQGQFTLGKKKMFMRCSGFFSTIDRSSRKSFSLRNWKLPWINQCNNSWLGLDKLRFSFSLPRLFLLGFVPINKLEYFWQETHGKIVCSHLDFWAEKNGILSTNQYDFFFLEKVRKFIHKKIYYNTILRSKSKFKKRNRNARLSGPVGD